MLWGQIVPSLFVVSNAIDFSLAAFSTQKQPASTWAKKYAQLHKEHIPSPQELAAGYRKIQHKKEKAKVAHEKFLKSPAYHTQMIRRAHREFQQVRRQNTSATNGPDEAMSANGFRCGDHIPLADLGIANNTFTRALFWRQPHAALLQGGPSMAAPGSGVVQVPADNGRSIMGTVTTIEDPEEVTPFVKVFKDGFSLAGCFKDQMYDFGDMYGDNKDQYREAHVNVSIVKYKEVVLKEKQVAMTPKKCYEFCRTVPDMVFFGVKGGRDCYCMPFYKPGASGSGGCDVPCEGDPIQMCGGEEKSSIFEMHMCADTAGDLLYKAVKAEVELVYFYDTAFMADKLGKWLERAGKLLEKVAGSVGDEGASALAQEALRAASSLFDPNTGWGLCRPKYRALLDLYIEAKPLYDADFTFADKLQEAEDLMFMMENLRLKLHECAKDSEMNEVVPVYPFYFEFMASLDEKELQKRTDKYITSIIGYYPAIYMMNPLALKETSSCKGELMQPPKPIPFSSCAEACDQTVHPVRCAGFQYFQFMDGDTQIPLCFLFKELEEIRTYRCKDLRGGLVLEQKSVQAKKTFRGAEAAPGGSSQNDANLPGDICAEIKTVRMYSYLSCEAMFGKESRIKDICPDECADPNGAMNAAICVGRMSLGRPRIPHVEVRRCFGKNQGLTSQADADWRLQEFGVDASGGAGPKIEGEIKMGGTVVKEPYGYVWTPGPAGQR
eukprot:gnl/MRDRNA2_/MRDRNA2_113293_c0_seq1.p1 gnl/MRDRNA2_/MRDRNA2_113293_c0~~gnl/MRDRNA2_/MRDRNA2_113293_c0_seq1.p1  ORF type:complete len:722 (+),score=139.58 gnl/MRDRNA2_/MRDRNA2_113293_c0_seq1:119-2284(+)